MAGSLSGANISSATQKGYHGAEEMHAKASKAYHPKESALEIKARKAFQSGGSANSSFYEKQHDTNRVFKDETKAEKIIRKMRKTKTTSFPKE
jgi:hypothetical protein